MKQLVRLALAAAVFVLAGGVAFAAQPGMKCVQQQLNELGFDAGSADGAIGGRTRAAAEAYNAWMETRDPSKILPPLSAVNGRFWCEQVAAANPAVAVFNVAEEEEAPAVLLIQFRGNVPTSFRMRVGAERANTSDCNNGPCLIVPLKERTIRSDSKGLAVTTIELPPRATRACVQVVTSAPLIDGSELFLNDGKKRVSQKGGDLEGNGRSACSDSGSDAKLASTWVLTLK